MRSLVAALGVAVAVLALGVGAAAAKLTPVEQKWAAKVVKIYNDEAAALDNVQAQERASNALIADSGTNNTKLTATLSIFASCPTWIKQAGKAPTARLKPAAADMVASCGHLYTGAKDTAHVIGLIGLDNEPGARSALAASLKALAEGSKLLVTAERALVSVGGKAS
jgi:hypothetical protein